MKKLLALILLLVAAPAVAQQFPVQQPIPLFGPGFDPSNPVFNFNTLIQQINNFLVPTFQANGSGVNFITIVPGQAGLAPVLGTIGPGANVNFKIEPQGNGNIVLFSSLRASSTGTIKIGNQSSFQPLQGLAGCPGIPAGKPIFNTADHITGYLMIKDWLDRLHAIPAC